MEKRSISFSPPDISELGGCRGRRSPALWVDYHRPPDEGAGETVGGLLPYRKAGLLEFRYGCGGIESPCFRGGSG